MKLTALAELPDLLQEADAITEELRQMEASERDARATLERVANDESLDMASQEQQMMSARVRLDLIPARRRTLEKKLKSIEADLRPAFGAGYKQVRARVSESSAAKEAELRTALAPFFDAAPESKAVRNAVETLLARERVPAIDDLRRLYAQVTDNAQPAPPMPERVRWLLQCAQRVGKTIGWGESNKAAK